MRHTFFVPARNSRHRIAALALYRALVRSARQVELPTEQKQVGGGLSSSGKTVHPLADMVKRRFQSNKSYTSLRLVYSSMSAGYKFLSILTKARIVDSPEHDRVVNLIRQPQAKKTSDRSSGSSSSSSQPKPKKQTTSGEKGQKKKRPPLLVNVAEPGQPPRYTGRPRPASILKHPRRVPTLCAESLGYPFLRYRKPHPPTLDSMVARNRMLWEARVASVIRAEEEMAPAAALEDRWEDALQEEMARAGLPNVSVPTVSPMPALSAEADAIRQEYVQKGRPLPVEDGGDPFIYPVWASVVQRSEGRLKRWMARTPRGDDRYWKAFERQVRKSGKGSVVGEDEDGDFWSSIRAQRHDST
ncbi:DNA repair protein [Geosmithia morbida]|uniref:DNA repair protein n=1 Tax=Geosmithia morbida TaxID=1094350 RepID=A0A9P4YUT0_9HYPO|nr:DNA repair protein [Geosmithia morbida]KAF4122083.1 DNA repair protein [Geosmithia morbida]